MDRVMVPPLYLLEDGSFEAQCNRCTTASSAPGVSEEHAWSVLLKAGWTWNDGDAVCPTCSPPGQKYRG